jgi:hypothetical protein
MSKSETQKARSSVLPSGARVTYGGHRELPESEQQWEIHLRPKPSPDPQNQSPDDHAHKRAEDSAD